MHIKTGTWEASNTVCESETLCDQAVLVSATKSEPQIRNRRLSPGSGNCGGGGGGCISGNAQSPRQRSPQGEPNGPSHAHGPSFRREKERKNQPHKGRAVRRESQKGALRAGERLLKANQKEKWVEDSLSLLKPPPAFPVQDSPAKLQPAVSYASKVKAGATSGTLEEERPAIGDLLQNQWEGKHPADLQHDAALTVQLQEETPVPASEAEAQQANGDLLLSCRHLVEALNYHNRDPKRVMWYKETQERPA
uniref:Si:ch211-214j24.10 n=1 Tax=Poecilia reticulata TaxID=8081 RepID=A0A3P9PH23_POERE